MWCDCTTYCKGWTPDTGDCQGLPPPPALRPKLKTLGEANEERRKGYEALQRMGQPHANGIACPNCGKELWDSNPFMTLTSNPPQKNVHCPECSYRGFRIA